MIDLHVVDHPSVVFAEIRAHKYESMLSPGPARKSLPGAPFVVNSVASKTTRMPRSAPFDSA